MEGCTLHSSTAKTEIEKLNKKCRLCLMEKKLQKSHIIPEFFFRPLYDGLHRLNIMSSVPKEENRFEQKGFREKLLCYDCEQLLSPFEDYARRFLYGGVELRRTKDKNPIRIMDIDYHSLKLFQLSLLWRASASRLRLFAKLSLPSQHEERLRKMIINKDAGEVWDYGCMMIMLTEKNQPMDEMIGQPEPLMLDGHRCYRFMLGGCFWIFVVSKHARNFLHRELFLDKDGNLSIPVVSAKDTELMRQYAKVLRETGKLNASTQQ